MMAQIARESGKSRVLSRREVSRTKDKFLRACLKGRQRAQTATAWRRVRQNSRAIIADALLDLTEGGGTMPPDEYKRWIVEGLNPNPYADVYEKHIPVEEAEDRWWGDLEWIRKCGYSVEYVDGGAIVEGEFRPAPTQQSCCFCEDCNVQFWQDYQRELDALGVKIAAGVERAMKLWR